MIDVAAVAAVALVYAAGVVIPGPNFVLVVQQVAAGSRALALAAVGGIVLVNALWASAALFGLSVALVAFPWAHDLLRFAGGAYLAWFGWRVLRAAGRSAAGDDGNAAAAGAARAFAWGAATNLANAKSMAFSASVFSAAAPASATGATLLAMVGVVVVVAGAWYGGVALLLSTARLAALYRRGRTWVEHACGGVMIGFGCKLAVVG